jgi:hypothetical protein
VRALSVFGALVAATLFETSAWAAEADVPVTAAPGRFGERGQYVHLFTALGYGRGVRWNNPYRLQTELGDSPSGLSLSAGYWDLALGASLGAPDGVQHGLVLHLSVSANGIAQQTLSASYFAQVFLGQGALVYARGGVPFVLTPDTGIGVEAAAGAVYFVSGGVGVNAELVQSLFVGAGTWEHDPTLWPMTSLQMGLWFDIEVLP